MQWRNTQPYSKSLPHPATNPRISRFVSHDSRHIETAQRPRPTLPAMPDPFALREPLPPTRIARSVRKSLAHLTLCAQHPCTTPHQACADDETCDNSRMMINTQQSNKPDSTHLSRFSSCASPVCRRSASGGTGEVLTQQSEGRLLSSPIHPRPCPPTNLAPIIPNPSPSTRSLQDCIPFATIPVYLPGSELSLTGRKP